MAFIRGLWQVHPQTGTPGIWFELSSSPPGTISGVSLDNLARDVPKGGETPTSFSTKATTFVRNNHCKKLVNGQTFNVIELTITFSSLDPLTVDTITIGEGDFKAIKV